MITIKIFINKLLTASLKLENRHINRTEKNEKET